MILIRHFSCKILQSSSKIMLYLKGSCKILANNLKKSSRFSRIFEDYCQKHDSATAWTCLASLTSRISSLLNSKRGALLFFLNKEPNSESIQVNVTFHYRIFIGTKFQQRGILCFEWNFFCCLLAYSHALHDYSQRDWNYHQIIFWFFVMLLKMKKRNSSLLYQSTNSAFLHNN